MPRVAAEGVLQQVGLLAPHIATRPGVLALTAVRRDPGRALLARARVRLGPLQEALTGLAEPGSRTVLDLVAAPLRQLAEDPFRSPPPLGRVT